MAGGGAAGLLLARELSRKNINFALLEKNSRTGCATSAKSKGIVSLFPMDNPARLKKDLGEKNSTELLSFFRKNNEKMQDVLNENKIPFKKGIWYGSGFEMENEELKETAGLLKEFCAWKSSPLFHDIKEALYVKEGFFFNAEHLINQLSNELKENIYTNENVITIEKNGGTRIVTERNTYEAEIVVACLNAYTSQLFPGWGKFFIPVRAQSLSAKQKIMDAPAVVNYGHEIYVPNENGTWMGGINPNSTFDDMTYDETPTDIFQSYMEMFFEQRWGIKPDVTERSAGTVCMTPTGFPFIGAVPGRVDLILFGGFCARGWDYIARGAEAVATLILKGDYILPDLFRPANVFV